MQIVLIIACLVGMIAAVLRFKRGETGIGGLLIWIFFWAAAGVVVIWPDATFYFSRKLGIGRGADLVVYVAIVLLFFAVFRLVVVQEKQRREITRLTRLLSLKDAEDKK
jgi:hypothetical protein